MSNFSTMNPSIAVLPEEIQTYILSKVEGYTGAVAKRVCRLWHELITGLETCFHFWLRKCLEEIPSHTLVELTRLIQLSGGREVTLTELAKDWTATLESKLPWMFWREVYAEFHRCCYIKDKEMKRLQLHYFPLYGEVSCLLVQDNVLYSGHENGAVMSWQNIETEMNCDVIYTHKKRVACIAGLDMVTSTHNILNGEVSCKIVSSSRDASLILYNTETEESSTIVYYSKQVNCVRCWSDQFVAAANGSFIQGQPVWTCTDPQNLDTKISITLLSQSTSNITTVAFWDEKVVSGDELGNLYEWSLDRGERITPGRTEEMFLLINLDSPVKSLHMLGHRIVCFTDDKKLHISRYKGYNEFDHFDVYKQSFKTPECVAVRGSILAIGFKAGSVNLYHIPTHKDIDNLDITKPSRVIHTHCEHVNAIAIGDYGGGPFVVIATEKNYITVVQFRRSKKNKK